MVRCSRATMREPAVLEALEDRTDEAALDGVGLEQDEGALGHDAHGRRRRASAPGPPRLLGGLARARRRSRSILAPRNHEPA